MEAMQKLKEGQRFSEVATAYSEDKARQGVHFPQISPLPYSTDPRAFISSFFFTSSCFCMSLFSFYLSLGCLTNSLSFLFLLPSYVIYPLIFHWVVLYIFSFSLLSLLYLTSIFALLKTVM